MHSATRHGPSPKALLPQPTVRFREADYAPNWVTHASGSTQTNYVRLLPSPPTLPSPAPEAAAAPAAGFGNAFSATLAFPSTFGALFHLGI